MQAKRDYARHSCLDPGLRRGDEHLGICSIHAYAQRIFPLMSSTAVRVDEMIHRITERITNHESQVTSHD